MIKNMIKNRTATIRKVLRVENYNTKNKGRIKLKYEIN